MTGARIQLAREALGLDPAALAGTMEIAEQDLLACESGEQDPEPEVLWNLAHELNVDLAFLLRSSPVTTVTPASPRLERLGDAEATTLIAQTRLWLERYLDIESYLMMESLVDMVFPDDFPYEVSSGGQAAEAAEALRRAWGLGEIPVKSMVDLLEDAGFKVGLVDVPGDFDACAFWSETEPPFPLIAVQQGLAGDRQRFAMARELAYFMLEGVSPQTAGHFAGAFLIPEGAIRRDLGDERTDLDTFEVYLLKQKYGAGFRSVIARIASLRLIPRTSFDDWMAAFNDEEWSEEGEPGGVYPPEVPGRMLRLAFHLETEEHIGEERTAEMVGLPWLEWDDVLHLADEGEEEE